MGADEIPIGRSLREARRRRGLTLKAVAEEAGVTESFLSQVERDIASPSIATLRRIAVALAAFRSGNRLGMGASFTAHGDFETATLGSLSGDRGARGAP